MSAAFASLVFPMLLAFISKTEFWFNCYTGADLQGDIFTECMFVIPRTVMLLAAIVKNL